MIQHGLIIGKFHPLHDGHLALMEFAAEQCEILTVVICAEKNEKYSSQMRKKWVKTETQFMPNISIDCFEYDSDKLPNTSTSSKAVSKVWSEVLKQRYPFVQAIFSSELYGDYVAEYMGIRHIVFDIKRFKIPVAASLILSDIKKYWEFLPKSVKEDLITKICLVGTESTGKSTLSMKLAKEFDCEFVPEMAREIIPVTDYVTYSDLIRVANDQANAIINYSQASKAPLLIVDTDIITTKSYARFLFDRELKVDEWIDQANEMSHYFFMQPNCPFIQDGTRLNEENRIKLHESHINLFKNFDIKLVLVDGSWDERLDFMKGFIKSNYAHLI